MLLGCAVEGAGEWVGVLRGRGFPERGLPLYQLQLQILTRAADWCQAQWFGGVQVEAHQGVTVLRLLVLPLLLGCGLGVGCGNGGALQCSEGPVSGRGGRE